MRSRERPAVPWELVNRPLASIQTWRRTGGGIIRAVERRDGPPVAYGIRDSRGRLMVVMVHDSDIPDGWEREAEDPQYFFNFSPDAYAVGIDVLLYAMSTDAP